MGCSGLFCCLTLPKPANCVCKHGPARRSRSQSSAVGKNCGQLSREMEPTVCTDSENKTSFLVFRLPLCNIGEVGKGGFQDVFRSSLSSGWKSLWVSMARISKRGISACHSRSSRSCFNFLQLTESPPPPLRPSLPPLPPALPRCLSYNLKPQINPTPQMKRCVRSLDNSLKVSGHKGIRI